MSDTLTYVEGAHSLASGEGYVAHGRLVTVRPPGYSLSLVPLVLVGTDTIRDFKVLNIVFAVAAVALYALAISSVAGKLLGLLAAVACGISFPWIYYTHAVLSEMLFTFLLAVFLVAGVRQVAKPGKGSLVALIGAAAALPMVRFAGIAVLPVGALILWLGSHKETVSLRRRFGRMSVGVVVALCPMILYFLRNMAVSGQWSSYETGVSAEYALTVGRIGIDKFNMLTRMWVNARGYLHILIVPDQSGIARVSSLPWWLSLACAGSWVMVMVGVVRALLSSRGRVLALTSGCYGGLLMVNIWYDIRYLLPVLPLFFWFLADGMASTVAWLAGRIGLRPAGSMRILLSTKVLSAAFLSLVLVANMAFALKSGKSAKLRSENYEGVVKRMHDAAVFTSDRPEAGAVLVAGGAGFVRLWSGRRVVNALSWLDADRKLTVQSLPDDVSFVLLDENEFAPYRQQYLEPLVEASREELEVAFEAGRTVVFVRREASRSL
ncbi:MAG: hypothetical protein QGH42_04265 [Kiritimatiellia bacterium]|jgi:4-amino-4-deoxy-L-arabinose transferase-like glycosyltransferase|nr:hypothetical protein [Kiritimatiellia bacterium]